METLSVSGKIKTMLALREKTQVELATHLGISPQSLHNKMYRNKFSADDLVMTADFLNMQLAFTVDSQQKFTLSTNDINSKKNE
jgi:ABC-type molybdenum transport system ATPase subunit/photorepair protein PhrA